MTVNPLLEKYAQLLVDYCVELQPGDRVYIRSTTLAEPLVREVYKAALLAGAVPEVSLDFREQDRLLLRHGNDEQLSYVSGGFAEAMQEFQAYILIRAPFNLRETGDIDPARLNLRQQALAPASKAYFERTATRALKRTLCQYPTEAAAAEAGMTIAEYEQFVFDACRLYEPDPKASWIALRDEQQRIVDHLNGCRAVRYTGPGTDISFSTEGRTWINSHGTTNMPSGEVYTSPVETSVEGHVYFNYPLIFRGTEIEGIRLRVQGGEIVSWEADRGGEALDALFAIPGARRFGEAAIGTNWRIRRFTKNILFDEKIGGTIHMAVGQSYLQAGGRNESAVHLDMITDMTRDAAIHADGALIYENGVFLI